MCSCAYSCVRAYVVASQNYMLPMYYMHIILLPMMVYYDEVIQTELPHSTVIALLWLSPLFFTWFILVFMRFQIVLNIAFDLHICFTFFIQHSNVVTI